MTASADGPLGAHPAREELLELVVRDGIFHRTPERDIVLPGGRESPWMLDSLGVTLAPRGAELSAQCLLALLARFEGRQLATLGASGVPLMQACVLHGGGRYHGLMLRKAPKPYGARKVIEGRIAPDEPVVLVDDSVYSGATALAALEALERAGLRVEGLVCLVRWGEGEGVEALRARGLRVAWALDLYADLVPRVDGERARPTNPTRERAPLVFDAERAPEGLHPAHLARLVMREYLLHGRVLSPPDALNATRVAGGGAWVSVRSREDPQVRHAREGFWVLPGEDRASAACDVVTAAVYTAQALPQGAAGAALLEASALAVTTFSPLEACAPGGLDNERYGIVVRGRERPWRIGGALPRMPGIGDERAQLEHARARNAGLFAHEPYEIFRHDVARAVEPGASWPSAGAPRSGDEHAAGDALARRAFELARGLLERGAPGIEGAAATGALPEGVDAVFVSVYIRGELRGCMGVPALEASDALSEAVRRALADPRFDPRPVADDLPALAVVVSLVSDAVEIADAHPDAIAPYVLLGRQALMVHQGARRGMLLPFVAVAEDLDPRAFVAEVVDKAGITRPPYRWTLFDVASHLADASGACAMDGALPRADARPTTATPRALAALHADYLLRTQRDDGTLLLAYRPLQNTAIAGDDPVRLAHAAWVLARAARGLARPELAAAARRALDNVAPREDAPAGLRAFALAAWSELPAPLRPAWDARALCAALAARFDRHGRFAVAGEECQSSPEALQSFWPGQALLALATAHHGAGLEFDLPAALRALRYYAYRLTYSADEVAYSWLCQAFSACHRVTGQRDFAAPVLRASDALLAAQQDHSGAFLSALQPEGAGATSALALEGLASALLVARRIGDAARVRRYEAAVERALGFLARLTLDERDRAVVPNMPWARGGLRMAVRSGLVRTDYVAHALAAELALID